MEEIEVTWNHAIRIWWSLAWRGILFSVIAGALAGFIVGAVLGALGMGENIEKYGQLVGLLVGIPVGIWVVRIVLTLQFRSFRIALVPSTEALLEKTINEGK